jgi:inner membrane protein
MPSIFSHAVFATAVGRSAIVRDAPWRFWALTAGCAMLPDADAIAFWFHVPYGSMWGHRGITHSIAFAVLAGTAVTVIGFRKDPPFRPWQIAIYFFFVTLSHPLLDMLTNGGSGVALFAPFTDERYFWPWRPIEVSPIGLGFFSERGLAVLLSEVIWVWLPAIAMLGISSFRRQFFAKK